MGQGMGKKALTVCITGASSGIGMACARLFAARGDRLLLCARRRDRLQALAHELQQRFGTKSLVVALDVRLRSQVEEKLGHLPDAWSAVDVLINNAGLALGKDPAHAADVEHWDQMVDTNLKGLAYVTRVLLPGMVQRDAGHIINIGSIAGRETYAGGSVYCATKHAVRAFSSALRMDLLGTNIRISSVDPGFVETEFSLVRFEGNATKAAEVYRGMRPLRAEDVAEAVMFCVERPAHVNVSEILLMPVDQAAVGQIYRGR